MVFNGKNLIISANGNVLAASRSCSIDVNVDTIPTSSPNDGVWEHRRPGRARWSISTNHLLPNVAAEFPLVEVSSPSWVDQEQGVIVKVKGHTLHYTDVGVWLFYFQVNNGNWIVGTPQNFDTSTSQGLSNLITAIGYQSSNRVVAIACRDNITINDSLINTLNTVLHIPSDQLRAGIYRSFAAIGNVNSGATGLAYMSQSRENGVHAMAYYVDDAIKTIETPLKSAVNRVGQVLDIQVSVNGNPGDILHGSAICERYQVQGTYNNLIQGGFSFVGTGPLE